jgi:4-hydroxy-4-methyl-2-oxoglutarate aldolase
MDISENGRDDGRDVELLARLDKLHVAAVSDCLDRIGIRDNVMAPHIRPLARGMRVAGFAATVLAVEVDAVPDDPYAGEIHAVDSQQPGDVMVVSTCSGSYWGELLATSSRRRGAVGIVADCYTRDTRALIAMNYPTFVAGISAQDSLGRIDVAEVGCEIECGAVRVAKGDLILADDDGVVVVPSGVADEVLGLSEEKVATENIVRASLADGSTVKEVFAAHGIL